MRRNRLFSVCCSSLLLLAFAGCKKIVKIQVDQSLAPITATTVAGATLEWTAAGRGESFDVSWQDGLCQKGTPNPIHASYGKPAICRVASQTFGSDKQPIIYTYSFDGKANGKPCPRPEYKMAVGPGGCRSCL
jgi:hypothetical protein